MSLKEKYESSQSQWAAEAKRAQNQQVAEADFLQRCQRMYEELGLQTSDGISEKLYKDTLPIELPPEYQALIDEFIEICPSKAWEKSPDPQVDRAAAHCKWGEGWPDSRHLRASCGIKDSYISQVKLSDGSIHLYYSNLLSVNLDLGVESDLVKPSTFFTKERRKRYVYLVSKKSSKKCRQNLIVCVSIDMAQVSLFTLVICLNIATTTKSYTCTFFGTKICTLQKTASQTLSSMGLIKRARMNLNGGSWMN